MLTIISLATDTTPKNLKKDFKNIDKWSEALKEIFKKSTHYRFIDDELLIYKERHVIASCCYLERPRDRKVEITSAWTEEGQIYKK